MPNNGLDYGMILVEGTVGSGKSTTVAAYAIDEYRKSEGKLKIFAVNMHLYSTPDLKIKYVYCSSVYQLLKLINSDVISDGIIIIDESYIEADARRSSNPMTLVLTWFSQQIRKRHIHMYYIVQNGRFLEWRIRWMIFKRIVCEADDKVPGRIWLNVKYLQGAKRGTEKKFWYDGSPYWKYFNTDELPHVSDKMLERVKAWS